MVQEETLLTQWHFINMKIKSISSGSKGNSAILVCDDIKLIIDLGISYSKLKTSLEKNNISIKEIAGILITHNHKDHVYGIQTLLNKTDIPLYIPIQMFKSLKEVIPNLTQERCIFLEEKDNILNIKIELLHTSHDAPYAVGFNITYKEKTLTFITDTGYLNRKYLKLMNNKDLYMIESNYDEIMLMEGKYPPHLKERIISDKGHLSNKMTAKYLSTIIGDKTKTVILTHLSEDNNNEELAFNTTKETINNENIKIVIAKQYEETEFIEV